MMEKLKVMHWIVSKVEIVRVLMMLLKTEGV